MIGAEKLRAGMAIRYQGQPYKVVAADYHPGQGKMGGANHLELRNLETGTLWQQSLRAELKVEELPIERLNLEYLYSTETASIFMHLQNFEQIEVPSALLGAQARFLSEGMQLPVEFVEGRPIAVLFPDFVEIAVAETAPPVHSQVDGNWKPARLGNGVEVMVPPFVKSGESIRLNLNTLKYMERARARAI